jgi:hypothetical protein
MSDRTPNPTGPPQDTPAVPDGPVEEPPKPIDRDVPVEEPPSGRGPTQEPPAGPDEVDPPINDPRVPGQPRREEV